MHAHRKAGRTRSPASIFGSPFQRTSVSPCLRGDPPVQRKEHAIKMQVSGGLFRRHPALLRLALLALLAELGYAIIVPTLPLYLSEALKTPDRLIGWIVTAFAVVETILQGPF